MKRKFIIILLFIISFGLIGNLIILQGADKLTEETTSKLEAHVASVNEITFGKEKYFEISTKEYDTILYISPELCSEVDIDHIKYLKANHKIIFRIENIWMKEFEESSFVKIVSLDTEQESIFSLEEYNEYVSGDIKNARMIGSMVVVVCGGLMLYFMINDKKSKRTI